MLLGWGVKPRMASPPPNRVTIIRAPERKAKWKDTKLEGKNVYLLCAPYGVFTVQNVTVNNVTITKRPLQKNETSMDPLSHLYTFLWHAHHCACAHTYSYSHTHTVHIAHRTSHITLHTTHITHCTSRTPIRITHGTPVGQCIARRTHKPMLKKLLLTGTPSVIARLDRSPIVLSYQ